MEFPTLWKYFWSLTILGMHYHRVLLAPQVDVFQTEVPTPYNICTKIQRKQAVHGYDKYQQNREHFRSHIFLRVGISGWRGCSGTTCDRRQGRRTTSYNGSWKTDS